MGCPGTRLGDAETTSRCRWRPVASRHGALRRSRDSRVDRVRRWTAALVLGFDPASTTFLPEPNAFVRWVAADSEKEVLEAVDAALASVGWEQEVIWRCRGLCCVGLLTVTHRSQARCSSWPACRRRRRAPREGGAPGPPTAAR
ncbi:Imm21 family immunity protein [Streptomyces sp. NPDC102395]|uniref:Imm21 family immunity protein n=1 Tax=Streptomyces sp. NPDC102395 TaxID=3366168 RepID=UPI0037F58B1B